MSMAYDAKQRTLKAYPKREQLEDAIELFLGQVDIHGMGQAEIEYELGKSIEEYLYGTLK